MFQTLRPYIVFTVLLAFKALCRLFYRFDLQWLDQTEGDREDPWSGLRLCALLNHTSLFDVLFLAVLPNRVLWLFAHRVVAPGADVTLERPILGRLLGLLMYEMIPITRKRDETWERVLAEIDEDIVVLIAPEGRMMRKNGLDKYGEPMTVRGGIADILEMLETLPGPDTFLIAHSQGVHHVQAPGERWPRLFRKLSVQVESASIKAYAAERRIESERDEIPFRDAVVRDLEARRAAHCP